MSLYDNDNNHIVLLLDVHYNNQMAVGIQPTAAPEHPGLTREMLLAVVLLLCANIATVCSGIALVAYGTRSGQKALLLNKIFEGSDYEATVFDDPARASTECHV